MNDLPRSVQVWLEEFRNIGKPRVPIGPLTWHQALEGCGRLYVRCPDDQDGILQSFDTQRDVCVVHLDSREKWAWQRSLLIVLASNEGPY